MGKMTTPFGVAKTKELGYFLGILFALASILPCSHCLYEDQIGKFDW